MVVVMFGVSKLSLQLQSDCDVLAIGDVELDMHDRQGSSAPFALYVPAAHAVHTVSSVAPTTLDDFPAAHRAHIETPFGNTE
jgi:hypothetical protein